MSRRVRAFVVAAAGATAATQLLTRTPPGGAARWERTNFRGTRVSLLGGPAVAAGALAAVTPLAPAAAVVAGAAAFGAYDDLFGDSHARGLRGHIDALRHGRVTTGMVKLAGLVGVGAVASVLDRRALGDAVVETALVAGTANLVNLLDLRPGRALKAAAAVGIPLAVARPRSDGGVGAAAAVGVATAVLPADLGERLMVGDCGANAIGALLGWSLSSALGPAGRRGALAAVVGLTLASERVSFTDVIARTPWLAVADEWGRGRASS